MSNTKLANEMAFFPLPLIQVIEASQGQPADKNLIERSLDTPDWTPDHLWQAGAYFHARFQLKRAMPYYHRLLQWTTYDSDIQADVFQAIGHVFLLSELYQDAKDAFKRSAGLKPDAKIDFFLAECNRFLNLRAEEEQDLQRFIAGYQTQDAMLARAYVHLIRARDGAGHAEEARQLCLQAAKALDSWGFALQAQSYRPLLPTDSPLPPLSPQGQAASGEQIHFEEFFEVYAYRKAWDQEDIKPKLETQAAFVSERIQQLLPGEKLAQDRAASMGRRIVIVGGFHRPDCEPYLDALIALCRKNSVTLISTGPLPARLREEEWLRQVQSSEQFSRLYEAIQSHAPDLLIYMDAGPRSPASYLLASLRLAPVQAVMGVHPCTTGHRSIDYFLSFDWLEPENAAADYSESLRLLKGTPSQASGLPEKFIERASFNLPADRHHYVCPVTCASVHPAFMQQLAEILTLDPQGQILLTTHSPALDARFRAHFAATHGELSKRLHFLPPIDRLASLSLCRAADVLLDPMYTSLSYSLWQLIPLGTPIVTWASGQARGRYAAGLYTQLEVTDSIAPDPASYARTAVALAQNAEGRAAFREKIEARKRQLFQYSDFLASLEAFVSDVLDTPQAAPPAEAVHQAQSEAPEA